MRNELRSWALTWSLVGVAGWALLPWYAIADGIFSPGWPARILADRDLAPAALQAILFGRAWLMGPGLALLAGLVVVLRGGPRALFGGRLMMFTGPGVLFSVAQGFAIGQPAVGAGAALTVAGLPPPFVIGLGLILLFGRSGLINQGLEWSLGVPPSRWIYGLPGVWLAQTFAFTPVAFLVLIGVVQGVSPSLEEASQTLRAGRWQTFSLISLPLMRPGLANAFLVGFIESIADFGNPIVLGGNFGVLSTEIFFSIVGAQLDQGRAAALGLILLALALSAFFAQRRVVGRKAYTSMSGKGDSGPPAPLPPAVRRIAFSVALPWALLTLLIYAMALAGGFVQSWGRDYPPTLGPK